MTKKISNMLLRMPLVVIIMITVNTSILTGVFTSLTNENASKITQVFSVELLRNICITMLVWKVFMLIEDVFMKTLETLVLNQESMKWYRIVSNRENIRMGNKNISDTEIISLMKELGMTEWLESLNDGLDTIVGEKGCKLSSGLKQRVKHHPVRIKDERK